MKFQNRRKLHVMKKVRMSSEWGMIAIFYIFIGVCAIQVCAFVKTQRMYT
jgi:hypothetical protein